MAAEIIGQHDDALGIARAYLFKMLAIDRDVGAAEPVDRLLRIAHRAQPTCPWTCQPFDHVDLHLIGVLELVDHDKLELVRVLCGDFGVIRQRTGCEHQQIAVVEHTRFLLRAVERLTCALRKQHERFEMGLSGGKAQLHNVPVQTIECLSHLFLVICSAHSLRDGQLINRPQRPHGI